MERKQTAVVSKRRWMYVLLPICLSGILIAAFIGVSQANAQTAPVHFTTCAFNTGANSTFLVPSDAPKIHTEGDFIPAVGDEFAVFRPVNGSCKTLEPSLWAGAMGWDGGTDSMPVWADNTQTTTIIDGMLFGEAICWRVWDASANHVYTATVVYELDPSGNGTYIPNTWYIVDRLDPTAVELQAFTATSSSKSEFVLIAGSLAMVVLGVVIFWSRRSRIMVK